MISSLHSHVYPIAQCPHTTTVTNTARSTLHIWWTQLQLLFRLELQIQWKVRQEYIFSNL